jgi:hypothetical protein
LLFFFPNSACLCSWKSDVIFSYSRCGGRRYFCIESLEAFCFNKQVEVTSLKFPTVSDLPLRRLRAVQEFVFGNLQFKMFGRKQLHDWFEVNKKAKSDRIFQVLGEDGKESEQASFLDLDHKSYALSKYLLDKYPINGKNAPHADSDICKNTKLFCLCFHLQIHCNSLRLYSRVYTGSFSKFKYH